MIRETDDDEEEMKYQVTGRDFCFDLCGVTDVLSKLMEMMTNHNLFISLFDSSQSGGLNSRAFSA